LSRSLRSMVLELVMENGGESSVDDVADAVGEPVVEVLRAVRGSPYLELEGDTIRSVRTEVEGYLEVRGPKPVLITAPHAQGPRADVFTGEIAYKVARATGANALVATVSRAMTVDGRPLDLNREWTRDHPFRRRIEELKEEGVRFIVDVHGMADDPLRPEIDLGTLGGRTMRASLVRRIIDRLEELGFDVGYEQEFYGGDIVEYHCDGRDVQGVQVELSESLRAPGSNRGFLAVLAIVNVLLGEC